MPKLTRFAVPLLLLAASAQAAALTAPSAVVLDPETGREVYAAGADTPRPPASTTKLITALIAIERLDPDARLPVSTHAASMPRTKAELRVGSRYPVRTLLQALLVGSSNDAAVVLAEGVAGSEHRFAELMTQRARELGCDRTTFRNASGLGEVGQVSTCRDLIRIFEAVRENPTLMDILGRQTATVSHPGGGQTVLRNHNKLLGDYASAPVGKTGYTRAARHCFVGSFVRDGREYRVACMGSSRLWDDLRALTGREAPLRTLSVVEAGAETVAGNDDYSAPAWSPARVRAVRQALAKLGYRLDPSGAPTKALTRFQKLRGLLADGQPRDATRKALARRSGIKIP